MSHQDWEEVVFKKRQGGKPKNQDDAQRVALREGGSVESHRKYNAGRNVQKSGPIADARKLERDDEDQALEHEKVSLSLSIRIQQARLAKKWSQKDLAIKINEKQTVINEYESGKAIPNNQVLGKLERALGTKLRGKQGK